MFVFSIKRQHWIYDYNVFLVFETRKFDFTLFTLSILGRFVIYNLQTPPYIDNYSKHT